MQKYVEVKILDRELYTQNGEVVLPKYATDGSAGIDLIAANEIWLKPGQQAEMKTGIAIYQGVREDSTVALVLPRSGLGKKGLVLANTVGVVDADYQGEFLCNLFNRNSPFELAASEVSLPGPGRRVVPSSQPPIHIKRGERFAQVVFLPLSKVFMQLVDEFSEQTSRGAGGFGSTGS